METQEQSKQKFITLMKNLIQHINENPAHQLTIYQCLNTQQIKRLFQSLHDYSRSLRLTALIFISKLLYNSPQIVDTLLTRDNCDLTAKKTGLNSTQGHIQKYIITGLKNYNLSPLSLAQIVLTINSKMKYRPNSLFWYIDIQSKNIGYFSTESNIENTEVDPKTHIIGIFVGETQTQKAMLNAGSTSSIKKGWNESIRGKYSGLKGGQFSISRKN